MIAFERIRSDARLPERQHDGDAAFDVFAYEGRILRPLGRGLIPTGLRMSLPAGYVAMVLPRSGLALEHGIAVLNAPGLVDANYRGELGVVLANLSDRKYHVHAFDRIAQLLVVKYQEANVREAGLLAAPDGRGAGGFGSTGR